MAQPKMLTIAGFEEPFIATGPTGVVEDRALRKAIAVFRRRAALDGFIALDKFLKKYPKTSWRTAVLTNLGLSCFHHGFFSRALRAWQAAWTCGHSFTEPYAKAMTDRAFGELVRMHARLGHIDALNSLLADVGDRLILGQAKEHLSGARHGLWVMRNDAGIAFLCGTQALKN
jgi:hypothetical protein